MTRVLAVADSDSYLKWSAATLAAMPAEWDLEQIVISNPIEPSPAQIRAAAGDDVPTLRLNRVLARIAAVRPDVLLLACTGPVVQAIVSYPFLRRGTRRPVIVTGLPGISVPATERAVEFRSSADLFIVHSQRERSEFEAIAAELGAGVAFALASLPFVGRVDQLAGEHSDRADRVVFAAQAKVPMTLEDRQRVLQALADSPPQVRPVVKLRAAAGEEQTHRERWAYPDVWDELVADGLQAGDEVEFIAGSMDDALRTAVGFVTVSSTAALEAMGARIPVLIISDFGVSAEMINLVFEGSGCLGTLDDLRRGRFFTADPAWLGDNYFHPDADNDWVGRIEGLVERRRSGTLPYRALAPVGARAARWKWQARLMSPSPVWLALRRSRARVKRLARRTRRLWNVGQHERDH